VRVLGVDPGLTRCGLGVVDAAAGRRVSLVEVGVVGTEPGVDLAGRLLQIEVGLEAWLDRHSPDAVAVERVFSQHNVRTVMGTAQAGAVAILAAARRGITGNGRADKAQVGAMVARLLGLASSPSPADAADALALAICHAWRGPANDRLARAVARQAAAR